MTGLLITTSFGLPSLADLIHLQNNMASTQNAERCKKEKRNWALGGASSEDGSSKCGEEYQMWKSNIPVLYDWFTNHSSEWPLPSCRWGPIIRQGSLKNRQRLYLSEQTDKSVPNTLIIANCDVVKPRVAAENHIAKFNEEARSPFLKKYKTMIHPGEANRIRELPQNKNIVATHTDCPEVLIWDIEAQPNKHAVPGAAASRPDLVLSGHQDNAEFALALSPMEPFVLSGGKDKTVVLWSIQDHISTLAADAPKSAGSAGSIIKSADNPSIGPRGIFQGHDDTVEDVQFCPSSSQEFCSVGDDSCLILWDARVGNNPVVKVEKAHDADLHCVDWNPHNDNLIITGSADNSVRLFDRRNLTSDGVGSPLHMFEHHTAAVLCVQWCPDRSSVFGSSSEDGLLNIWDYEKVAETKDTEDDPPPGLFFQHAGHRDKIVDFHWNTLDPWTIVSVSDDLETNGGGGTLQIWRMTDLVYRTEKEVLSEMQHFKDHVSKCAPKSKV
ncbi:WD-40 repeat-containing protein MSI4-like isoform X1 [Lycium barbarum]|uniref:WD-40 repeat-containing protein MSI4-like isoform X1 n=2 Tax=Lycium barbarum TaxID=112863 RepID=UPI00293F3D78|nr:WD-40 repeat-containing protein MSI4-like isoform X1 [Lycium barbarum]